MREKVEHDTEEKVMKETKHVDTYMHTRYKIMNS